MKKVYVKIVLGHLSFCTRKICIVELYNDYTFIETYVEPAKRKACEKFGLDEKETFVFDWDYLGDDVTFIR